MDIMDKNGIFKMTSFKLSRGTVAYIHEGRTVRSVPQKRMEGPVDLASLSSEQFTQFIDSFDTVITDCDGKRYLYYYTYLMHIYCYYLIISVLCYLEITK